MLVNSVCLSQLKARYTCMCVHMIRMDHLRLILSQEYLFYCYYYNYYMMQYCLNYRVRVVLLLRIGLFFTEHTLTRHRRKTLLWFWGPGVGHARKGAVCPTASVLEAIHGVAHGHVCKNCHE